jgi:hypothetical protein
MVADKDTGAVDLFEGIHSCNLNDHTDALEGTERLHAALAPFKSVVVAPFRLSARPYNDRYGIRIKQKRRKRSDEKGTMPGSGDVGITFDSDRNQELLRILKGLNILL